MTRTDVFRAQNVTRTLSRFLTDKHLFCVLCWEFCNLYIHKTILDKFRSVKNAIHGSVMDSLYQTDFQPSVFAPSRPAVRPLSQPYAL